MIGITRNQTIGTHDSQPSALRIDRPTRHGAMIFELTKAGPLKLKSQW